MKSRLDLAINDLGETKLKNIAEPVRVYQLLVGHAAPPVTQPQPAATESISAPLALPDKPSIAVLPFQNISGDPDQEYFCDGMVEDIVTGLSHIKWLFVIARNSSFVYKGKPIDVKQVGRDLGVRYVLEGSVRKAANRIRITGQLIEAETGTHLWADRYDGALEDVFDLQDKITETIVGIIEPNLRRAEIERARRKRPDNLGAPSVAPPGVGDAGRCQYRYGFARTSTEARSHLCRRPCVPGVELGDAFCARRLQRGRCGRGPTPCPGRAGLRRR